MQKIKSHSTAQQIANKHQVTVAFIKNQLKIGIPIEHEHTKDNNLAKDIALQHLDEIPDYYTRLKKMEKSAKSSKNVSEAKQMKGKDPCWKGYEMVGKKRKNGREVPNCVPVKEEAGMRYCPKCDKNETRNECKYGEKYWDMFSRPIRLGGKSPNLPHPGNFPESYGINSTTLIDEDWKTKVGSWSKSQVDNFTKSNPGSASMVNKIWKEMQTKKNSPSFSVPQRVNSSGSLKPSSSSSSSSVRRSPNLPTIPSTQKSKPQPSSRPQTTSYQTKLEMSRRQGAQNVMNAQARRAARNAGNSTVFSKISRVVKKIKNPRVAVPLAIAGGVYGLLSNRKQQKEEFIREDSNQDRFDRRVNAAMSSSNPKTKIKLLKVAAKEHPSNLKLADEYSNWRADFGLSENWKDKKHLSPEERKELMHTLVKKTLNRSRRPGNPADLNLANKKHAVDVLNTNYGFRQNNMAQGASPGEAAAQSRAALGPSTPKGRKRGDDFNIKRGGRGSKGSHGPETDRGKGNKAKRRAGLEVLDTGDKEVHYRPTRTASIQRSKEKKDRRSMERRLNKIVHNKEEFLNWRADFGLSEDWQKINRRDKTDGLSQKAVNAYRREHPGSKLQTAVTEKKPSGKRAKRRSNFCSRMKGMRSKLTSSKTARDPDSRINKALRRWRCR